MKDKRVQVYIRYRGQTITAGNEFKTENFDDTEEMFDLIKSFIKDTISDMEEGEEDE